MAIDSADVKESHSEIEESEAEIKAKVSSDVKKPDAEIEVREAVDMTTDSADVKQPSAKIELGEAKDMATDSSDVNQLNAKSEVKEPGVMALDSADVKQLDAKIEVREAKDMETDSSDVNQFVAENEVREAAVMATDSLDLKQLDAQSEVKEAKVMAIDSSDVKQLYAESEVSEPGVTPIYSADMKQADAEIKVREAVVRATESSDVKKYDTEIEVGDVVMATDSSGVKHNSEIEVTEAVAIAADSSDMKQPNAKSEVIETNYLAVKKVVTECEAMQAVALKTDSHDLEQRSAEFTAPEAVLTEGHCLDMNVQTSASEVTETEITSDYSHGVEAFVEESIEEALTATDSFDLEHKDFDGGNLKTVGSFCTSEVTPENIEVGPVEATKHPGHKTKDLQGNIYCGLKLLDYKSGVLETTPTMVESVDVKELFKSEVIGSATRPVFPLDTQFSPESEVMEEAIVTHGIKNLTQGDIGKAVEGEVTKDPTVDFSQIEIPSKLIVDFSAKTVGAKQNPAFQSSGDCREELQCDSKEIIAEVQVEAVDSKMPLSCKQSEVECSSLVELDNGSQFTHNLCDIKLPEMESKLVDDTCKVDVQDSFHHESLKQTKRERSMMHYPGADQFAVHNLKPDEDVTVQSSLMEGCAVDYSAVAVSDTTNVLFSSLVKNDSVAPLSEPSVSVIVNEKNKFEVLKEVFERNNNEIDGEGGGSDSCLLAQGDEKAHCPIRDTVESNSCCSFGVNRSPTVESSTSSTQCQEDKIKSSQLLHVELSDLQDVHEKSDSVISVDPHILPLCENTLNVTDIPLPPQFVIPRTYSGNHARGEAENFNPVVEVIDIPLPDSDNPVCHTKVENSINKYSSPVNSTIPMIKPTPKFSYMHKLSLSSGKHDISNKVRDCERKSTMTVKNEPSTARTFQPFHISNRLKLITSNLKGLLESSEEQQSICEEAASVTSAETPVDEVTTGCSDASVVDEVSIDDEMARKKKVELKSDEKKSDVELQSQNETKKPVESDEITLQNDVAGKAKNRKSSIENSHEEKVAVPDKKVEVGEQSGVADDSLPPVTGRTHSCKRSASKDSIHDCDSNKKGHRAKEEVNSLAVGVSPSVSEKKSSDGEAEPIVKGRIDDKMDENEDKDSFKREKKKYNESEGTKKDRKEKDSKREKDGSHRKNRESRDKKDRDRKDKDKKERREHDDKKEKKSQESRENRFDASDGDDVTKEDVGSNVVKDKSEENVVEDTAVISLNENEGPDEEPGDVLYLFPNVDDIPIPEMKMELLSPQDKSDAPDFSAELPSDVNEPLSKDKKVRKSSEYQTSEKSSRSSHKSPSKSRDGKRSSSKSVSRSHRKDEESVEDTVWTPEKRSNQVSESKPEEPKVSEDAGSFKSARKMALIRKHPKQDEDGTKPKRKKWGSVSQNRSLDISSDLLKDLIPAVTPLSASELKLEDTFPIAEEGEEEGEIMEEQRVLDGKDSLLDISDAEMPSLVAGTGAENDGDILKEEDGARKEKKKDEKQNRREVRETSPIVFKSKRKESSSEYDHGSEKYARKIRMVEGPYHYSKPAIAPAKNPVSRVIFIQNLVRPFTINQLRELLQRTGQLVPDGFWTDAIKSKCYAMYENEEQAEETRVALHGVTWPASNPNKLIVDFSTVEELKAHLEESSPPSFKTLESQRDKKWKHDGPVREWDLAKMGERSPGERERERERQKMLHEEEIMREKMKNFAPLEAEEKVPAPKLLEDLFRKTKCQPAIYWLPLTPEQIAVKEAIRRQKMMEHMKKMAELKAEKAKEEQERQKRRLEREKERQKEREKMREKEKRERNSRRSSSRSRRDRSKRRSRSRRRSENRRSQSRSRRSRSNHRSKSRNRSRSRKHSGSPNRRSPKSRSPKRQSSRGRDSGRVSRSKS